MDVYVEVLVEFDDAFEIPGLLFDGTFRNVEAVGHPNVVFLLEMRPVLLEAFDDFRLLDDLFVEFLYGEVLLFLEEFHGVVQNRGLLRFGDGKLLGQLVHHKTLGQRHDVLRVVVVVLAVCDVQEVLNPVLGFHIAVGVVHYGGNIALLPLFVEDDTAFVQLLDVDALFAFHGEDTALGNDAQEGVLVLGFEQTDGVNSVAVNVAVFEIYGVEVARLDVRVLAVFVQVLGQIQGLVEEAVRVVENCRDVCVNLVEVEVGVVVEVEVLLGFERCEEVSGQDLRQMLVQLEGLLGKYAPVVGRFVAHAVNR